MAEAIVADTAWEALPTVGGWQLFGGGNAAGG